MLFGMALVLDDPELEARVRRVTVALGRPPRLRDMSPAAVDARERAIDAAIVEIRVLPVVDARALDQIVGYDENGLPA